MELLRETVAAPGPFASVYVDASHNTEDAAKRAELSWSAVQADLFEAGAGPEVRDAIGPRLLEEPPVGLARRAIIAAGDQVLIDELLPLPPGRDLVRVGALPYLLPLVSAAPRAMPYVVAHVDKVGGVFVAVDAHGEPLRTAEVRGEDHPVHQPRGGGWAHRAICNRVAETVRRNVQEMAAETARLVDQVGAELLVVSGEVQGRKAVLATLPTRCQQIAIDADTPESTEALPAQSSAQTELSSVDRFSEARAKGTAVEGAPAVAKALRQGQVDTLLVADSVLGDRHVWHGPEPTQVAADPDELPDLADTLTRCRADEALPRRGGGHGRRHPGGQRPDLVHRRHRRSSPLHHLTTPGHARTGHAIISGPAPVRHAG